MWAFVILVRQHFIAAGQLNKFFIAIYLLVCSINTMFMNFVKQTRHIILVNFVSPFILTDIPVIPAASDKTISFEAIIAV